MDDMHIWNVILLVDTILIVILLIFNIAARRRMSRLNKKYNKLMNTVGDKNLLELVENCLTDIELVKEKNKDIQNKINTVERGLFQCIQKVGVIRYNAFDNVGGDLSFVIALLDSYDNGVVINGMFSRDNSIIYTKAIESCKSKYTLSTEEIQAIDKAKKLFGEGIYIEPKRE